MSRRPGLRFVASLLLASAGGFGCEAAKPNVAAPKPPVVIVAQPSSDYVADYEDFTGKTDAIFSVEIRARVSGFLDEVHFKDGDEVEKGDLLFAIDDRPYKANLNRTEASVAQGEARLKRLDADYRRVANLYSRGQVSREEFDKVSGDRSEAEAAVGVAQSDFELAKLNMTFTRIKAPISGRLSRRLVDPGNLVQADTTPLTTIVSPDPLYVYFDVDERTLLRLSRLVRDKKIPSRKDQNIPVMGALSDEDGYPHKGIINFTDNRVDPGTGTMRFRASIDNPKPRVLSPGLFMRVRLPVGSERKSIMVAEKALGTDQGQKYVYVIVPAAEKVEAKGEKKSEQKKEGGGAAPKAVATAAVPTNLDLDDAVKKGIGLEVRRQNVKVGKLDGGMREIEEGLAAGSWVVVEGLQRVRPGLKVDPRKEEPLKPPVPNAAPGAEPAKKVASRAEEKPAG